MQSVWLVSLYSAGETEEKRKTKRRQGKERGKAEEGEKYMKDMYGTLDYTKRGTWLGYRFKATTLDLLSNNII